MLRWRLCLQLALLCILGLDTGHLTVWAQPPIRVESSQHEAQFRGHILFRLVAEGDVEIKEITLFYRVADQPAVTHASPEFSPDTRVDAEYSWDLTDGALPPGVQVTYWWRIADREGRTLQTEPRSLVYSDERYDWRALSSEELSVYWYRGDKDFGQALFDKAIETLDTLSRDAGVTVTRQAKVFIYGSHSDLLGAIAEGAKEWTGGQAFPDVGIVVIGISPGNLTWGQRAVAHELTHLVIHQMVDTPLGGLPHWLDEGLAMYTEGELEPSYQGALDQAIRGDRVITVRSLSSSFPADSALAHLSYAQSHSLVEFVLEEYGREKMAHLLQVFAEGAYYDDALQEVLGLDSEGLDVAWREWAMAKSRPREQPVPVVPVQRALSSSPLLVVSAALCCMAGLLLPAVIGLLVFLRRR